MLAYLFRARRRFGGGVMTVRTLTHKARWRRTAQGRRLVCLCGWPNDLSLSPGAETARQFLHHIRETRQVHRV